MRICIWWSLTSGPWGGGANFLRTLARELLGRGHEIHHDPNRYADVVLVNAFNRGPGRLLSPAQVAQLRATGRVRWWSPFTEPWIWSRLPRRGPPIVHRVDGVAAHVRGFRTPADRVQPAVNAETDLTVFQSRYCRDSCGLEGIRPRHDRLIYNAVDPKLFRPADLLPGGRPATLRLIASSWSTNPRKGFPEIAALSRLPGVQVRFVGRWAEEVDPAEVELLGARPSAGVAEVLRTGHAFVHPGINEPCSNAIVEALATGLPVLYRASGGNPELAGDYGVALGEDLGRSVEELRARYVELRERVCADRPRFLIPRAAAEYLAAFEEAVDRVGLGGRP